MKINEKNIIKISGNKWEEEINLVWCRFCEEEVEIAADLCSIWWQNWLWLLCERIYSLSHLAYFTDN